MMLWNAVALVLLGFTGGVLGSLRLSIVNLTSLSTVHNVGLINRNWIRSLRELVGALGNELDALKKKFKDQITSSLPPINNSYAEVLYGKPKWTKISTDYQMDYPCTESILLATNYNRLLNRFSLQLTDYRIDSSRN